MQMTLLKTIGSAAALAALMLLTSACGGGGGGDGAAGNSPGSSASIPSATGQGNAGPSTLELAGTPPSEVTEGEFYFFQPTITDAGTPTVRFSVINKPDWAEFDPDGGILYGTPAADDVGTAVEVIIAANDTLTMEYLPPFTISVNSSPGNQSLTLSWLPPTQNEDGSALTDLAGYRIYYGTEPGELNQVFEVENPGLSSVVIPNLAPDTYYVALTAIDREGLESDKSDIAEVVVG